MIATKTERQSSHGLRTFCRDFPRGEAEREARPLRSSRPYLESYCFRPYLKSRALSRGRCFCPHDFGTFFSNFLLASLRWRNRRRENNVKRHAKNNQRTAPDKFPRYLGTSLSDFHGIHRLVSPAKKCRIGKFCAVLFIYPRTALDKLQEEYRNHRSYQNDPDKLDLQKQCDQRRAGK